MVIFSIGSKMTRRSVLFRETLKSSKRGRVNGKNTYQKILNILLKEENSRETTTRVFKEKLGKIYQAFYIMAFPVCCMTNLLNTLASLRLLLYYVDTLNGLVIFFVYSIV